MSQDSKHKRRSFSDEFKRDAVNLIVNQGYSFRAAAEAVGGGGTCCGGSTVAVLEKAFHKSGH